jgi:hypothetical protein
MKKYARVQDGIVVELFETDLDILTLFNPNLVWTEITDATPVSESWRFEAGRFEAPAAVVPAPATAPTVAELQLQVQRLSAQLSALGQRA